MRTSIFTGIKREWRFSVALCLLLITAGVYLFTRPSTSNQSGQVSIVAAENFWGNIASQVGASHANVTSIISNPNTDPHLYESNAYDAGVIANADIVIQNGLGYDSFMTKLIATTAAPSRQIISAASVIGASANANPHLWYDISQVHLVAEAIEKSLIVKDPAHTTDYQANLAKFENSLQPLTDKISQIRTKDAGQAVAYTERIPQYLIDAAGLNNKTPLRFASAVEDGNDPSPVDTQSMKSLLTTHKVKALLYNSQVTNPITEQIKQLAKTSGVQIIGFSETMPTGDSYQSWQLGQLNSLVAALDAK